MDQTNADTPDIESIAGNSEDSSRFTAVRLYNHAYLVQVLAKVEAAMIKEPHAPRWKMIELQAILKAYG